MEDPRWYVERSSLNARTDEDRAMASEKLGPFDSRDEARRGLMAYSLSLALSSHPGSIANQFGRQYLHLLYRMAVDPDARAWSYESVQWSIWEVDLRARTALLDADTAPEVLAARKPLAWLQITLDGRRALREHLRIGLLLGDDTQMRGFLESFVASLEG